MKKLLLVVLEDRMSLKFEKEAIEYCRENGFDYVGCIEVSKVDALYNPMNPFKEVQLYNPDIVLADGSLMVLSELSKEQSLLTYLEKANIECLNIEQNHMKTRYFVEGIKNLLTEALGCSISHSMPAVVIYKGNDGFENDQDFKDIARYINENLELNQFSLMLYRKENEKMLRELAEILKKAVPKYIILTEPFIIPNLSKFMDMIELDADKLDIQIIYLDEIQQELYPEQNSEININFILH